ncbi:MAG TPA: hypothetical protein VIR02_04100 [Anaerolineales bacterium]
MLQFEQRGKVPELLYQKAMSWDVYFNWTGSWQRLQKDIPVTAAYKPSGYNQQDLRQSLRQEKPGK